MNENKNGRTTMDRSRALRKLIPLFIAVIVVAAAVGIASRTIDHQEVPAESTQQAAVEPQPQEETVDINGVQCTPKKNIKTYLFMGLDSRGEAEAAEEYDGTGQCETLQLLVLNEDANTSG